LSAEIHILHSYRRLLDGLIWAARTNWRATANRAHPGNIAADAHQQGIEILGSDMKHASLAADKVRESVLKEGKQRLGKD